MEESSREDRARRILHWLRDSRTWTGNYDFFAASGLVEGPVTQMMVVDPMGLPPILNAKEILEHIFRSPILLERDCEAGWLAPIPDLEEPYFSRDAVYSALDRLLKGDKPARLEREPALKSGEPEIGKASTPPLVGAKEAAEYLDISTSTLRDYSEQGVVPCVRLGKTHRKYDLVQIREHLEKKRMESGVGRIEALKDLLR
jgi:hypothetical protein